MPTRLAIPGIALAVLLAVVLSLGVFGAGLAGLAEVPVAMGVAEVPAPRPAVLAPQPERGAPTFVQRYGPGETGGHLQSWAAVQAQTGLIYVANTNGVLEFDGASWQLIDVPNFMVRSLAIGPDGLVYVGGVGTAGVLVADSARAGRMVYREILDGISLGDAAVWGVFPTDRGVVFQTFDRLVEASAGGPIRLELAPSGQRFHKAFEAGGQVYVRLEGAGLLRYGGEALEPIPGGEAFADQPVRALFDADGEPGLPLLAVTDDALYRLDAGLAEALPIPTAASDPLRKTRAYHGCALGPAGPARLFAVTTLGGGVLILNEAGEIVEHLWKEAGLGPDDLVLGCAVDVQGGLWLTLSQGIVRVDAASPMTRFDARLGLEGTVSHISRHEGALYVATDRGVYRLRPSADGFPARFESVQYDGRSLNQAWALASTDRGLLASTTEGLYGIDGLQATLVLPDITFDILADSERVYAGLQNGLVELVPTATGWAAGDRVDGIEGEVRGVVAWEGAFWTAERDGRLFRIDPAGETRSFDGADGVPEKLTSLKFIAGELVAITEAGPYRVDYEAGRLRVEPALDLAQLVANVVDDLSEGYALVADARSRVWAFGRDRLRVVERAGGGWADVTPPALRRLTGVEAMRAEDGVVWIGTSDGLYRLAEAGQERYDVPVPALLRSVLSGDEELVPGADIRYKAPVRFRFSAAAFNAPEQTLFRSQLLGHDESPSPWSDEHFRDYTNLPPGDYAFRVEAVTASGAAAAPAVVAFAIPPPWYLTVWFIGLMVLLGGGLVTAIAQAASHRQRRRADAERDRADELHRLNEELIRADRLKDHMLANTSHELRTPLTAILGFSEILAEYEGGDPEEVRHYANHMLSGGRRLLRTVNDVLDIAQLRAGKVQLRPRPLDVASLTRDVVSELRSLAEGKGVGLAVFPKDFAVAATVDPDALARVVTNLVSNAIKFTDNGAVSVVIDADGGALSLAVRDTGRGIEAEFLPRLFDAFEQESTGHGRSAEGNGLGLSITRQLVELMGGEIQVASEVGSGSVFRVTLPAAASVMPLGADPAAQPAAPLTAPAPSGVA